MGYYYTSRDFGPDAEENDRLERAQLRGEAEYDASKEAEFDDNDMGDELHDVLIDIARTKL